MVAKIVLAVVLAFAAGAVALYAWFLWVLKHSGGHLF